MKPPLLGNKTFTRKNYPLLRDEKECPLPRVPVRTENHCGDCSEAAPTRMLAAPTITVPQLCQGMESKLRSSTGPRRS